ncbi:porin [Bosea sp. (in: a-proteobacteria)]|uniref:porin n=1 Tax=Bosea sp. (in: a-proteobacteria) TaxID=1871050 RepID=UPI002605B721|nr:porin [Bosea sp. (in: a-proteobacteria)]MCO5092809.1 porin [Bosea sp. (in: a-proteobacteria)]
MKLVKSLLLGSAAGIAAVAGAQAADLPSRKAAPVEYVRVCSAFGASFFYIPGTDTCLRIGGRVRGEYTFGERWNAGQDSYGTRVQGRIFVDARNQTAYGTLRTFVRFDGNTRTGSYRYGGLNAGANMFNAVPGTADPTPFLLETAIVQFGPLTAGKMQSFYSFYANDIGFSSLRTSDRNTNLLAYTATFGSGFSATISLEDPSTTARRGGRFVNGAVVANPAFRGMTYPDVVASLRVDQGWGSAQLSAAIGDRGLYVSPWGPAVAGLAAGSKKDEMGWAIQAGVKLNLPMIAAGDTLWLQAGYADGAIEYLGAAGGTAVGFGRLPAYVPVNFGWNAFGNFKATTGFNLVAAFRHFWTPQIRSDFIGSYAALKTNDGVGVLKSIDPKELILGASLVWMPVAGLDIGVEVLYSRMEYGARVIDAKSAILGVNARTIKSDDAWAGRLRIQRDF